MSELKIYGHEPTETAWGSPTPQREPKLKVTVNWSTRIVQNHRHGLEERTPLITEPRYEIEGSDFILTDESYDTLSQAFEDTSGRALSFPFKNPVDYYCTAEPEVFSDGIYQRGFLIPLGDGTGRIVKQFHCNGVNSYKTILHPIGYSFVAYDSLGDEIEGLTVNENTGIVGGVIGDDWIPCDCEYRGRYRFDVSELQLEQIKQAIEDFDRNVYRTISFRLIEDSYDKIQGLIFGGDFNTAVDIGQDLEITYSVKHRTRIESATSQKELRELAPCTLLFYLENGGKNRSRAQLVLTVFNCLKGRYLFIDKSKVIGRLDTDTLTIEQLGVNAFNIDGETRTLIGEIREFTESRGFSSGEPVPINVRWTFQLTTTNDEVPCYASVYMVSGSFDTYGQIGTYVSPYIAPDTTFSYSYPGPEVFVGIGRIVSGWVIEEDDVNFGPSSGASVNATLKFVWFDN